MAGNLSHLSESEQLPFEGYCDSKGFTSVEATRLQKNILHHSNDYNDDSNDPAFSCKDSNDSSCESSGTSLDLCCCNLTIYEIRKSLLCTVDTFLNSERLSNNIDIEYHEKMKQHIKE